MNGCTSPRFPFLRYSNEMAENSFTLAAPLTSMPFISGLPSLSHQLEVSQVSAACLDDIVSMIPLTRSQEGIWLDYVLAPQSTQYNLTLKATLVDGNNSYDGSLRAVVSGRMQFSRLSLDTDFNL